MIQAPIQLHVIACMDVTEMTALWSVQGTAMEKGYVSTMKTQILQVCDYSTCNHHIMIPIEHFYLIGHNQ